MCSAKWRRSRGSEKPENSAVISPETTRPRADEAEVSHPSPCLLALRVIIPLVKWCLEPLCNLLIKKRHGHHQKVLIVDSVPINAWYIEKVLRAALFDAQTLHSSLDQHERDQLVKKFNDPGDLKVLITTYDVGSDSICTKLATVLFSLCQVGAGAKKLSRTRASNNGCQINRSLSPHTFPGSVLMCQQLDPGSHCYPIAAYNDP
ncbi:Helicase C-terminal [Penicillium samsonianum]|uniref:Helicase C-terminal n=1 Tax=Penicillium samsonianum TaxID=1882272 RepID=UPI002547F187|nr:Helicase C-terminal [Penicillium samsonianum]KAJ6150103.1 Helicase C-terminal [Penicillium samsonianum]